MPPSHLLIWFQLRTVEDANPAWTERRARKTHKGSDYGTSSGVAERPRSQPATRMEWDRRDGRGNRVLAGVHFARLRRAGTEVTSVRLVLVE